jgi:diacylglycerol O-acyltransferase / wax synthase
MSAVTDDQTFNDPREATDAFVEAFGELRSAAGLSEQSSEPDLVAEHTLC